MDSFCSPVGSCKSLLVHSIKAVMMMEKLMLVPGCCTCYRYRQWLLVYQDTVVIYQYVIYWLRRSFETNSMLLYLCFVILQIVDARNVMVVVSRWYGGILLGPDRFKHINNCTRHILQQHNYLSDKVLLSILKQRMLQYHTVIVFFLNLLLPSTAARRLRHFAWVPPKFWVFKKSLQYPKFTLENLLYLQALLFSLLFNRMRREEARGAANRNDEGRAAVTSSDADTCCVNSHKSS